MKLYGAYFYKKVNFAKILFKNQDVIYQTSGNFDEFCLTHGREIKMLAKNKFWWKIEVLFQNKISDFNLKIEILVKKTWNIGQQHEWLEKIEILLKFFVKSDKLEVTIQNFKIVIVYIKLKFRLLTNMLIYDQDFNF